MIRFRTRSEPPVPDLPQRELPLLAVDSVGVGCLPDLTSHLLAGPKWCTRARCRLVCQPRISGTPLPRRSSRRAHCRLTGCPAPLMPQTRTTSTNLPRAGAQGLPCALELAWSRPVFGTPAVSQTAVVCASDLGVTAGQRLCVRSGEFPGQGLYNPMCNPTRSCSPNQSSPDLLHAYTARRPDHADMAVELRY
jgi:hypothetical protein